MTGRSTRPGQAAALSRTTAPALSQTTALSPSQAAAPALNQATAPSLSQTTTPALSQATAPSPNRATAASLSRTTDPAPSQTTTPAQATSPIHLLIDRLAAGEKLTRTELACLLERREGEHRDYLFARAREIQHRVFGNKVYIRGLIEFTNYCKNNCYYCGIRRDNRSASRYRLTEEQILECCRAGYELGFRTFVLQGGEDPYFTDGRVTGLIDQQHCHIVGGRNLIPFLGKQRARGASNCHPRPRRHKKQRNDREQQEILSPPVLPLFKNGLAA